jgi:hypothetical protein
VSILAQNAKAGHGMPHLLLLTGMKDRVVPSWHSEALWKAIDKIPRAGSLVRDLHRFEEGLHTCHAQPGYHARIKTFLDSIHAS